MKTIFLKELKLTRKSLFIWSFFIALLSAFGMLEYPFIADNLDMMMPALASMPKIIQIMFGVYNVDFTTPLGYYLCMYFWCCLLTYTHAVYMGASIISKDQRDKTSEYIFTKPYRRDTVVVAKALVAVVNIFVIAAVTGLVSILAMLPMNPDGYVLSRIIFSIIGMFFTQLVFAALGLLFSAIFRTYKAAVRTAVFFLLLSYTIGVSIEYIGTVDYLNFLSPIRYFNAHSVVSTGLNPVYILLSVAIVLLALYFTVRFYRKKEFFV